MTTLKSFDQLNTLKTTEPNPDKNKTLTDFQNIVQDEIIDIIENGDTKVFLVLHDDMSDIMYDIQDSLAHSLKVSIEDEISFLHNIPDRTLISHKNGKTVISFDYILDDPEAKFADKYKEAAKYGI